MTPTHRAAVYVSATAGLSGRSIHWIEVLWFDCGFNHAPAELGRFHSLAQGQRRIAVLGLSLADWRRRPR